MVQGLPKGENNVSVWTPCLSFESFVHWLFMCSLLASSRQKFARRWLILVAADMLLPTATAHCHGQPCFIDFLTVYLSVCTPLTVCSFSSLEAPRSSIKEPWASVAEATLNASDSSVLCLTGGSLIEEP